VKKELLLEEKYLQDALDYVQKSLGTARDTGRAVPDTGAVWDVTSKALPHAFAYLRSEEEANRIDGSLAVNAWVAMYKAIPVWTTDSRIAELSPSTPGAILDAIQEAMRSGQWADLVNTFRGNLSFGTGGIRGMMAFHREAIRSLKEVGLAAPILRGPNTLNEIVILLTAAGVAKYGRTTTPQFQRAVVGYDCRINGFTLASLVARVFLHYGYTVYLFDAECPYPEVTYAIPHERIQADVGVYISASHNDYRYNGFKLSCANGSQFDPEERDKMYESYIAKATTDDIGEKPPGPSRLMTLDMARPDQLWFLGGEASRPGWNYYGHGKNLINLHDLHREHVRSFLLTRDQLTKQQAGSDALHIGFCAFHGVGNVAVMKLLREVGFPQISEIQGPHHMHLLDGTFPSFCSDEGNERQPDPGDYRAARIAVESLKWDRRAGQSDISDIDVIVGTDPDADRCGIVARAPKGQEYVYSDEFVGDRQLAMVSADEMWTLLLWFRMMMGRRTDGSIPDAAKKFVVVSHTTTEAITRLALKHNIGVVQTWVGFASLAAATRIVWDGRTADIRGLTQGRRTPDQEPCNPFVCECLGMDDDQRSINIAAMEQSNGFSILGQNGGPRSLGIGGHVRDKDGTLAAILVAEVAAYAKRQGLTLFEILDREIYSDPDIGLFVTRYEPDPLDGEYPGIEGDKKKMDILVAAWALHQRREPGAHIAGRTIVNSVVYRTGKYDRLYQKEGFVFPDEGIRFYLDPMPYNHVTVRPSGTGNSLRFHVQLHDRPTPGNLVASKYRLRTEARNILSDVRSLLSAPR
jgi:phosphoglucomutase